MLHPVLGIACFKFIAKKFMICLQINGFQVGRLRPLSPRSTWPGRLGVRFSDLETLLHDVCARVYTLNEIEPDKEEEGKSTASSKKVDQTSRSESVQACCQACCCGELEVVTSASAVLWFLFLPALFLNQ